MLAYFNDLGVEGTYYYDYGDGWEHRIELEGYMFRERDIKYSICIVGERACPPMDCGGVVGYYNVLRTLSDPEDDDHEDMRTWWERNGIRNDSIRRLCSSTIHTNAGRMHS